MTAFFDTNVLVYAVGTNDKGRIARDLLDVGGLVSVQCLNEFTNVVLRKIKLTWPEALPLLADIRRRCGPVVPLTETIYIDGLRIAQIYKIGLYDSMIVAAALAGSADILYSEDMHHGLVVDGRLTIINPFRA
ncbi:PIN domain-containing protein [uncultured Sphingomonas sp.]|uniref:PIN domain-containing protein n=1 Tax=uncultured Sphingomonas sp. TaxID=158754 RepID=UPI0035C94FC6